MKNFSDAARDRLLEPWEEFVGYVYDDKVPKQHGHYPEWDGGAVKGTLTLGFGHTDAAGLPKLTQGMRCTREEAGQILARDLQPCVRAVNRLLKVDVTQHQFDMLVDTYFNCPTGAVAAIKLYNAGQGEAVPAKLLQYVCSKGERMQGLVNRRNAEIAWGNTPDGVESPPAPNPEIVFSPKAERNPPPKTMATSKTGTASLTIAAGAVSEAATAANDALEPIKQAKGSLEDLGLFDHLQLLASNPKVLIAVLVVGFCVFIWWDRRNRLVNDHV